MGYEEEISAIEPNGQFQTGSSGWLGKESLIRSRSSVHSKSYRVSTMGRMPCFRADLFPCFGTFHSSWNGKFRALKRGKAT